MNLQNFLAAHPEKNKLSENVTISKRETRNERQSLQMRFTTKMALYVCFYPEMYPECVIASWDGLAVLLDAGNIERRVQMDAEKKKIECLCKLQTPGKNSVTRYANLCFVKTIFIIWLALFGSFRCKFPD